jgi:hypothetical protein
MKLDQKKSIIYTFGRNALINEKLKLKFKETFSEYLIEESDKNYCIELINTLESFYNLSVIDIQNFKEKFENKLIYF